MYPDRSFQYPVSLKGPDTESLKKGRPARSSCHWITRVKLSLLWVLSWLAL